MPSTIRGWLVVLAALLSVLGCGPTDRATPMTDNVGSTKQADTILSIPANGIVDFGQDGFEEYGQTITAPASDTVLSSFAFQGYSFPDSVTFRAEIYAWNGARVTGPKLYESAPRTGVSNQPITFDTGGVGLVAGQHYAVFLTAAKDAGSGYGWLWASVTDVYPGGNMIRSPGRQLGGTEADWASRDWDSVTAFEMGFSATFEPAIPSATTLAASTASSASGEPVAFVSTTTSSAGTPTTGSVMFMDGEVTLGVAAVDGTGTARLTTSELTLGARAITATYGGGSGYGTSVSAPLAHSVASASTITTLVSSSNPSRLGDLTTFTATVTVDAPGAGTPSGTVTFHDGATVLGTTAIDDGGVARWATAAMGVGIHDITADYAGTARLAPSTSADVVQRVAEEGASIELTSTASPSTFGSAATFSAAVSVTGPRGGSTGTVTFEDGAAVLGTVAMSVPGVATFSTATLAAGAHPITATYTDDATHAVLTAAVSHVIAKAATSTGVVSARSPSPAGGAVTFMATVASAVSGFTGQVEIFDGTTSLGVGTLAGDTAIVSAVLAARGQHSITATYRGDANFTTSVSAALLQAVDAPAAASADAGSSSEGMDAGVLADDPAHAVDDVPGCGCRVGAPVTSTAGGSALFTLASVLVLSLRRRRDLGART